MSASSTDLARFQFLAEAFHGVGGFAPRIVWVDETVQVRDPGGNTTQAVRRVPKMAGPCHLVPHPRESPEKFAARAATASYENHLREACERFVGYLGRRRPMRQGTESPLAQLLLGDADLRGTPLDGVFSQLAMHAKARGSVLLLLDMPGAPDDASPRSLQDQIERRAVPYLRILMPEDLLSFEVDAESGAFTEVRLRTVERIAGKHRDCIRTWTAAGWALHAGDELVANGEHRFGQCPVLPFTESGDCFPHIGKYAQIADMSRGIYNHRSRLEELLAAQTFSILTLQVPQTGNQNVMDAVATIGTSSILTHQGNTPAFISPDQGNAETYLRVIDSMQQAIRRVAMDEASAEGGAAESGIARRLRFERLNSDLASFASRLQSLERRMWKMFHQALGTTNRVTTEWPTDFNIFDTLTELDVLSAMQVAGFGPRALALKRRAVAAAEFDAADEADKAAAQAEIDETLQGRAPESAPESDAAPPDDPAAPAADMQPIIDRLTAIEAALTTATRSAPPTINVSPPAVTVQIEPGAIVANVQAPPVTTTIEPGAVVVTVEQPAPPQGAPITLQTGSSARVISLIKDSSGQITGAAVNEA